MIDKISALSIDIDLLIAILLMVAVAASVITFLLPIIQTYSVRRRMKAVTLERDRIRMRERERFAKERQRSQLRQESKTYMKQVVDRLNLRRHLGTGTIRAQLAMAGYRGDNAEIVFLFFRLAMPLGLFFFTTFYIFFVVDLDQTLAVKVGICIAAAYAGVKLPEVWISNLIQKRRVLIQQSWPDALDLIVICIASGMPIEQAFHRVSREIGGQSVPLAEELILLNAELSYLPDRRSAYEGLSNRTGVPSIKTASRALIQAERYGTHLGEALKVVAQESREERMAAAEKKAAALPPMLTVPMIIFFLPVLFVIIMSPAVINVLDWK